MMSAAAVLQQWTVVGSYNQYLRLHHPCAALKPQCRSALEDGMTERGASTEGSRSRQILRERAEACVPSC